MISNLKTATQISGLMQDLFRRVDESVDLVRQTCSEEETDAYIAATSGLVGAIVMDVCEPLYDKNPSLKPRNWDD
jgi:hypothetical protein